MQRKLEKTLRLFEKNSLLERGVLNFPCVSLSVKVPRLFVALSLVWCCSGAGHALDEGSGSAPLVTHGLAPGQTMAAVARLYGVPLASVLAANPELDPQHLMVGEIIRVPAPAGGWPQLPLGPGETLESVAERLNVPPEALRQLNPGFQAGSVLVVPRLDAAPGVAPRTPPVAVSPASMPPSSQAPAPEAPAAPSGSWELVTLADGRRGWAPRSAMLLPALTPLTPQQVVETAQRFVGAPYRWGGQSPNGVDCSGFVQEVFRLSGHQLPRLADEQFASTAPVESPEPGDLVFFSTYLPGPSHVGISLGGREFLHASSSRGVIRASLDDEYFKSRYLGARRLQAWGGGTGLPAAAPSPGTSSAASLPEP